MIRTTTRGVRLAVLVLAAIVASAGGALADHHGENDGDVEKKIHVKKVVKKCDGDDCDGKYVRRIMISGGGEVHELGDDDATWVSAGSGGKVLVKKIEIDCDGDDCGDADRVHEITIDAGGEAHGLHGDHHVWVSKDGDHVKKIRVKKRMDCEGDDCEERKKRIKKIVIDDDGEIHELEGKGLVWLGDHGSRFHYSGHRGGGFLGVGLTELTNELREHFGVPADVGVMVASVVDDSPAAAAGLSAGDIITAVNGESVDSGGDLARRIRKLDEGAVAGLEVWRDGVQQSIDATIGERKGPERMARVLAHDVSVDCDGDEDCRVFIHSDEGFEGVCEGMDDCEVEIECRGREDCSCTVNGEDADCDELHELGARGGE